MLKRSTLIFAFVIWCAAGAWYFTRHDDWNAIMSRLTSNESFEPLDITVAPRVPTGTGTDRGHHSHGDDSSCSLPATSAVTKAAVPLIYHWTDAQGQQHYGDRPPAGSNAAIYQPDLPERLEYFNLSIEQRGAINTPDIRNQLTPQVTGIYQVLGEMIGRDFLRKVNLNIALYPDRNSYLRFARSVTGRDMDNTLGFYSSGINEAVTYIQSDADETMKVARHESTHVIVTGVLGRVPVWLNEGLADYFSMISIVGLGKKVSEDPALLAFARQSLSQGYPRNLTTLFSLDAAEWRSARQDAHYAVSWALVYFLMSSKQGKVAIGALMRKAAENYCRPMDSTSLLEASYPGGIRRLQRDFYEWVGDGASKGPHYY